MSGRGGGRGSGHTGGRHLGPDDAATQRARLAALVADARLAMRGPRWEGVRFDDQVWDLAHQVARPGASGGTNVAFTRQGTTRGGRASGDPADALPARVADALKARVVMADVTGGQPLNVRADVEAARYFLRFLDETAPGRAAAFEWFALANEDLARFERWLETAPRGRATQAGGPATGAHLSDTSRRNMAEALVNFRTWLAGQGVMRAPRYAIKARDTRYDRKLTPEARAANAADRLPPPGALEALADIYHRVTSGAVPDVPDHDRLLLAAAIILLCTGLRANELLTLPADCERWQRVERWRGGTGPVLDRPPVDGAAHLGAGVHPGGTGLRSPVGYRYGLRFFVEKAGLGSEDIRWVSDTVREVVEECVATIRQITRGPRTRARVLRRSPDAVPLPPELDGVDLLDYARLVPMLGLGSHRAFATGRAEIRALYAARLSDPKPGRRGRGYKGVSRSGFRREDVQACLQAIRATCPAYVLRLGGHAGAAAGGAADPRAGKGPEPLWPEDALFTVYEGFFRRGSRPIRLLVTPVEYEDLYRFLGGNRAFASRSAFDLYGTREAQDAMAVGLHAFRHWLTSVAYAGKMPVHRITAYFARVHAKDTEDYLHDMSQALADADVRDLSDLERAAWLRDEVRAGRVLGDVALTYWSLAPELREEYLESQLRSATTTPWGFCRRNLQRNPCEKHLACVDCEENVQTKGDARQVAALEDLLVRCDATLRYLEEERAKGNADAERWIAHHAAKRAQAARRLADHRAVDVPDGTDFRPADLARRLAVLA